MADMKNSRLELCNRIRMEAEHTEDTGFPLDAFPQAVQSVILDMTKYENYMIEFIATSMLSAASTALGGTYRIRIKSDWQSNGALYIILVGRPGLGKTPPLEAAYRPIRKHDYALFKAMRQKWKHGKRQEKTERNLFFTVLSYPTSHPNRFYRHITAILEALPFWWMRSWACSIPPTATRTGSS